MPNRYYNDNGSGKLTNEGSKPEKGRDVKSEMPIKTANWPGLPGGAGPDRSGGSPRQGSMGPFYVYSEMSPKQKASGGNFTTKKVKID